LSLELSVQFIHGAVVSFLIGCASEGESCLGWSLLIGGNLARYSFNFIRFWSCPLIISHKHKFIFVKTKKTAGTSIEIALSKYCGPDDIITPISPKDEKIRESLGYRGPQNYLIPFKKYSRLDLLKAVFNRERKAFFNHAGVSFIKSYIDKDIWQSYYKFTFERNPWDKIVSAYYWKFRTEPRPSISDYIQSGVASRVNNYDLYSHRGELAVDKVYLYEAISEAMQDIALRLKLGEVPELPRAKSGVRKDKRSYQELMTEQDKQKIAKVYAREIAHFDYQW
jgi:hypothetical protein